MCDKCIALDKKIHHYKELSAFISDKPTLDGLATLIRQHEGEKGILHPEQKK